MYLKRLYKNDDEGKPVVCGVRVLGLGASADQHFTPDLVLNAIRQGWMKMEGGTITLIGENMTVDYAILREPGYYCCHCGERLADGGETALAHLAERHDLEESPDPENPSGYERINYYDCVEEQPRVEE